MACSGPELDLRHNDKHWKRGERSEKHPVAALPDSEFDEAERKVEEGGGRVDLGEQGVGRREKPFFMYIILN